MSHACMGAAWHGSSHTAKRDEMDAEQDRGETMDRMDETRINMSPHHTTHASLNTCTPRMAIQPTSLQKEQRHRSVCLSVCLSV
mmetsp:Transcript_25459/g.73546  ORF Transcript_25459/g.73546 Transcript_25459/m.73546 type:complete len:84 (-) Transcript_25459:2028-2279(-)